MAPNLLIRCLGEIRPLRELRLARQERLSIIETSMDSLARRQSQNIDSSFRATVEIKLVYPTYRVALACSFLWAALRSAMAPPPQASSPRRKEEDQEEVEEREEEKAGEGGGGGEMSTENKGGRMGAGPTRTKNSPAPEEPPRGSAASAARGSHTPGGGRRAREEGGGGGGGSSRRRPRHEGGSRLGRGGCRHGLLGRPGQSPTGRKWQTHRRPERTNIFAHARPRAAPFTCLPAAWVAAPGRAGCSAPLAELDSSSPEVWSPASSLLESSELETSCEAGGAARAASLAEPSGLGATSTHRTPGSLL